MNQAFDSIETLNYNDRLDGYGFGEAEYVAKPIEERMDLKKYWPIDQYTFREAPIGKEHQPAEYIERYINAEP